MINERPCIFNCVIIPNLAGSTSNVDGSRSTGSNPTETATELKKTTQGGGHSTVISSGASSDVLPKETGKTAIPTRNDLQDRSREIIMKL